MAAWNLFSRNYSPLLKRRLDGGELKLSSHAPLYGSLSVEVNVLRPTGFLHRRML